MGKLWGRKIQVRILEKTDNPSIHYDGQLQSNAHIDPASLVKGTYIADGSRTGLAIDVELHQRLLVQWPQETGTLLKALDSGSVTIWNPSERADRLQIANVGDIIELSWGHENDNSFGVGFIGVVAQAPKAYWEGPDRGVRVTFNDGIPFWFKRQWNKAYLGEWNAWDNKWEDSAPWTSQKIAQDITEAYGFRFLAGQGMDKSLWNQQPSDPTSPKNSPLDLDVSVADISDEGGLFTETYTDSRTGWEWLLEVARRPGNGTVFRPPKLNGIDLYWNPTSLHKYLQTGLRLTHSSGLLKSIDPIETSHATQEPNRSIESDDEERTSEWDYQLEVMSQPLIFGGAIFAFEANREEVFGFSAPDARKPFSDLVQAIEVDHILSVGSGNDAFDAIVKCQKVKR